MVVLWLSAAMLQTPCHKRLSRGFDPHTHARLGWNNGLRTVDWRVRGALVL